MLRITHCACGESVCQLMVEADEVWWLAGVGFGVASCWALVGVDFPGGASVGFALPVDDAEWESVDEVGSEGVWAWSVAGAEYPGFFDEVGE